MVASGIQQKVISIHAPRVGSDSPWGLERYADATFQSTLPVWGATHSWAVRPVEL